MKLGSTGKHNLQNIDSIEIVGDAGFSVFELVVFIISVAIIYAYAANRFAEFPAQAERANFTAIITQLQAGINLELMFGMSGGRLASPEMLEGINPMDLMLSTPSNYRGVVDSLDANSAERRSWYFDRSSEELVYLVNDSSGVYLDINGTLIPTDVLRFKVIAVNRKYDTSTGLDAAISNRNGTAASDSLGERFGGILLSPTIPYIWGAESEIDLAASALAISEP